MAFDRGFNNIGKELEIIQEELQLRLDVQCVREQFLGLLESYTAYQGPQHPHNHTRHSPTAHPTGPNTCTTRYNQAHPTGTYHAMAGQQKSPSAYSPSGMTLSAHQGQGQTQGHSPQTRLVPGYSPSNTQQSHMYSPQGFYDSRQPLTSPPCVPRSICRCHEKQRGNSQTSPRIVVNSPGGHPHTNTQIPPNLTRQTVLNSNGSQPRGNAIQNSSSSSDEHAHVWRGQPRRSDSGYGNESGPHMADQRVPPMGDYEAHVQSYQQPHTSPTSLTMSSSEDNGEGYRVERNRVAVATARDQPGQYMSTSRARVKAFYENRHERLIARRMRQAGIPDGGGDSVGESSSPDHNAPRPSRVLPLPLANQSAPTPTPARSSSTSFSPASSSSDMENFLQTTVLRAFEPETYGAGEQYATFDFEPGEERTLSEHHTNTPVMLSAASSSSSSRERLLDCDDFRNNNTPPKSAKDSTNPNNNSKVVVVSCEEDKDTENDPPYQNLTPISEGRSARSSRNASAGNTGSAEGEDSPDEAPQLPPRCPLPNTERYSEYLSHKSPPDDLGEYVTLKAPSDAQSMHSFFSEGPSMVGQPGAPSVLKLGDITGFSMGAPFAPAMLSMSFMSDTSSNVSYPSKKRNSGDRGSEKDSPVRYAKSSIISELYTKKEKSLLDISQISNISGATALSDSVLSTLQYPLHSTMIGSISKVSPGSRARAKQKLSFSDDDSLLARTEGTLDSTLEGDQPSFVQSADGRYAMSQNSIAYVAAPNSTRLSTCSNGSDQESIHINRISSLQDHSNNSRLSRDNNSLTVEDKQKSQSTDDVLFKTPKNPPRRPLLSEPTQTQIQPTLCKEHGLHPTFGGPCIFEDSFDLIETDDSDLELTSVQLTSEGGSSKLSSKRTSLASSAGLSMISSQGGGGGGGQRTSWASSKLSSQLSSKPPSSVARHNSVAETDCDSSYLSECVDDTRLTTDMSEAENYTAMYDSRRARMRIVRMRRQTGQANIQTKRRHPIGLSESDLLETTQKHLSLQAMRASMPDLQGLSSLSSFDHYSDELSESTLRDSPSKPFFSTRKANHSRINRSLDVYDTDEGESGENVEEFDLDETIISSGPSGGHATAGGGRHLESSKRHGKTATRQRPLSVCTTTTQATATTDESPESQGAMTVPVNSPNITDSGGSSSRQPTTDDYVDVPVNLPKMAKMLERRLIHTGRPQAVSRETDANIPAGYHRHRTKKRYPGSSAGSSTQQSTLGGSKQSLHVYSDPTIPDPSAYMNRVGAQRSARRSHSRGRRLAQSQDSGLSAQEVRARTAREAFLQQQQQRDARVVAKQTGSGRYYASNSDPRHVTGKPPIGASSSHAIDRERKKALAKKLRQFNNNFYGNSENESSLQLKTLAHF